MNKGNMIGNLTRDPELRFIAGSGKAVCTFTLAVDRPIGKDKVDFPMVVSWGKTAENCANYLSKGSKVAVTGSITTGSYDKADGGKVYTTKVFASRVEFLNSKPKDSGVEDKAFNAELSFGDFQNIENDSDILF